jgi:hypothetical protein
LLLAWAQSNNNAASSFPITISDSGWELVVTTGQAYNWSGLWAKPNCAAGETAPTFSDSGYQLNAGLLEFSGIATSSPLDQTGAGTATDPVQCASADTVANDLIVALSTWNGANADATVNQYLYGSQGTQLVSVVAQSAFTGSEPAGLLYIVSYQQNNGTLGTYGNEVHCSAPSVYEGSVSSLIASFKPA